MWDWGGGNAFDVDTGSTRNMHSQYASDWGYTVQYLSHSTDNLKTNLNRNGYSLFHHTYIPGMFLHVSSNRVEMSSSHMTRKFAPAFKSLAGRTHCQVDILLCPYVQYIQCQYSGNYLEHAYMYKYKIKLGLK